MFRGAEYGAAEAILNTSVLLVALIPGLRIMGRCLWFSGGIEKGQKVFAGVIIQGERTDKGSRR